MKKQDKAILISNGRKLLSKGKFPDTILESINDARLRRNISNQIFALINNKKNEITSSKEKHYSKLLLEVKFTFRDYLTSLIIFSNCAYISLITGLIMFFTSYVGLNNNSTYGIITICIGTFLLIISFFKKNDISYVLVTMIIYFIVYLLEKIKLGIPSPLISMIDERFLAHYMGAIILFANQLTPIVYEIIKILLGVSLIIAYKYQLKYRKAKFKFENIDPFD